MNEDALVLDRSQLEAIAGSVLDRARRLGARDATVQIEEGDELSVSVRNAELDTMQHTYEKRLNITLFVGDCSGSSSSSDFSPAAVEEATEAAFQIASRTTADRFGGPVERGEYAEVGLSLDLFHPWRLDNEEAIDIATRMEGAALHSHPIDDCAAGPGAPRDATRTSGGSTVSTFSGQLLLATSKGFCQGYAHSWHSLSCELIASNPSGMQSAHWWDEKRVPVDLRSPEKIGEIAARRALGRLDARSVESGVWPIIFEASVAASLLRPLFSAIGGSAQYRGNSFLLNCLGEQVMAAHVGIAEAPHVPRAPGSAPFDNEGVATVDRMIVSNGVINTYLLDSYAARRLELPLTGHAGGVRNARLMSQNTKDGDGLSALMKTMGTGLVVTKMLGGDVNPVTGDYSQGVAGIWIDRGEARYAVQDITVAGNLRDIYAGIVAIGADAHVAGTLSSGSILVDTMQIAGA